MWNCRLELVSVQGGEFRFTIKSISSVRPRLKQRVEWNSISHFKPIVFHLSCNFSLRMRSSIIKVALYAPCIVSCERWMKNRILWFSTYESRNFRNLQNTNPASLCRIETHAHCVILRLSDERSEMWNLFTATFSFTFHSSRSSSSAAPHLFSFYRFMNWDYRASGPDDARISCSAILKIHNMISVWSWMK